MRYLYTYLPRENTALTLGILSTAKAPSGWLKYKQRSGKTTKLLVLAYLDSLDKDRSKAFSAFSAPIPVDSDPAFVLFAKKKELYKVDLARLLKAKRILSIYKTGIGKATHKVDKIDRTSWKDKHPGLYLFSNVPHYIVAVKDGAVPPLFVLKQPDYKQQMLLEVARIAKKYKLPIFAVTLGASITRNNGSEAVRAARLAHAKWEDLHGGDSKLDWLKKSSKAILFPKELLPDLKLRLTKGLPVYTTRVSSDYNKYSKGDSLNSTLGKLKVADLTKLDTLSEHPFILLLTADQRQLLAKYKKLKLLKLILEQSR